MEGVASRHADAQSLRIGEPDVLRSHPDQPAGYVQRLLAGLEHAGEPVQAPVGIGTANRLVQGRDQVEVLFAGLVVASEAMLKGALDLRDGYSSPGG